MTENTSSAAISADRAIASRAQSKPAQKKWLAAAGICAAIAVLGIGCWALQLSGGMIQTGMRNMDSWGLYITSFMFFVGLSAGGLIISSIPNAFGIAGFGGISKVAIWTSVCCTIAAVGFVVVDLGNPQRLWELFAYSNLSSPLMWDVLVISIYLILSCSYLWATLQVEAGKMSKTAHRVISVIALVVAVLVHSVTAWIFGLNAGREMWHTALLAPWFVSSALVCGTALVMVVVIGLRRAGYLSLDQAYVVKMGKMLGAFCMVDLYFFGCDLLTAGFPAGGSSELVAMLTAGPLAPWFWAEIVLSALAAIICFTPALRKNPLYILAGVGAIVAIFCKRVQLLVGGFQLLNIPYNTVTSPYTVTNWGDSLASAYQGMVYWPTLLELGVTLGVIALAFALFFVGVAKLPLKSIK